MNEQENYGCHGGHGMKGMFEDPEKRRRFIALKMAIHSGEFKSGDDLIAFAKAIEAYLKG